MTLTWPPGGVYFNHQFPPGVSSGTARRICGSAGESETIVGPLGFGADRNPAWLTGGVLSLGSLVGFGGADILGGLLTSTLLNLFIMPSLSLRYGKGSTISGSGSV
ncbi:MAG TPA: hypothetical protein VGL91_23655 [Acidobacteriota bacterium]